MQILLKVKLQYLKRNFLLNVSSQVKTTPLPCWVCVDPWPLCQAVNHWPAWSPASVWWTSAQKPALLFLPARACLPTPCIPPPPCTGATDSVLLRAGPTPNCSRGLCAFCRFGAPLPSLPPPPAPSVLLSLMVPQGSQKALRSELWWNGRTLPKNLSLRTLF